MGSEERSRVEATKALRERSRLGGGVVSASRTTQSGPLFTPPQTIDWRQLIIETQNPPVCVVLQSLTLSLDWPIPDDDISFRLSGRFLLHASTAADPLQTL